MRLPVRASTACTTLHDAVTYMMPSTTTGVASTPRLDSRFGGPGQSEIFDVVGLDLVELAETGLCIVETVGRPILRSRRVGLDRGAVGRRCDCLDMIGGTLGCVLRERAAAGKRQAEPDRHGVCEAGRSVKRGLGAKKGFCVTEKAASRIHVRQTWHLFLTAISR